MASAPDGKGLPLEVAASMHERDYPVVGEDQPKNYGQVIRVAGDCGCPHPREWALPVQEVLREQLQKLEREHATYGELADLLNSNQMQGQKFVTSYHIDTQLGLNELARVIIRS